MSDDDPKRYPLGDKHKGVYFTRQEARCMICMLKGATVKSTAKTLGLSPRTAEYYVIRMRGKLQCHSKAELIRIVIDTDFIDNFGLDPMAL